MPIDQILYDSALSFINKRFGSDQPGGAAAMYTNSGRLLLSTKVPNSNASAVLCHETGAICEAWKIGERIVASICLVRKTDGTIVVFSPCGLCQERLMIFNYDIDIAVPDPIDSSKWISKKLSELQPFYWRNYKKSL